ncbi:MAG: hypothetical protein E3J64_10405, partial [Anaerolineales bacterium]
GTVTIRFGTDGWRAVISDEFTFANVRLVAQAIADYLLEDDGKPREAIVGFDTRFLSDRYATEVSRVLAGNGIVTYLTRSDAPSPAISYAVVHQKAALGVMITASHNAPRYNGIKLKADFGGAALPEQTKQIEALLERNATKGREPKLIDYQEAMDRELIRRFNPAWAYYQHLGEIVDLDAISGGELLASQARPTRQCLRQGCGRVDQPLKKEADVAPQVLGVKSESGGSRLAHRLPDDEGGDEDGQEDERPPPPTLMPPP